MTQATTPSGKVLFVCRMCGRMSPLPDKTCPNPPANQMTELTCQMLEEIEEATKSAPDEPDLQLYVGLNKDGTTGYVQWFDPTRKPHHAHLEIRRDHTDATNTD